MSVPINGNFDMFGITDETIQGAIKEGIIYFNGLTASIDTSTSFNNLISLSNITLFDPIYAGTITNISQITESIQYRNYPVLPSIPVSINWELMESQNDVFVDANFRIFVNNSLTFSIEVFSNSSGVLINKFGSTPIAIGDIIRVQYFYLSIQGISPIDATNPRLQLIIDNVIISDDLITPVSDLSLNHTFTITNNTSILVRGIAVPPISCTFNAEIECIFIEDTPTPTPIPPTPTPTPIPPTPTPTPIGNFFISTIQTTDCSEFCVTNYTIGVPITSDNDYLNIGVGNTIFGITTAGYYAISNVSTDTTNGPFKIAQLSDTGEVLSVLICVGSICEPI
jgi:hypothetical protein